MERRFKTYLRVRRRQAGFTQQELAFLVGCVNRTQISRYERLERVPTLRVLVAYAIIFQQRGYDLYPEIYHQSEEKIRMRARDLYEELQGSGTPRNNAKLDALETLLERIDKPRKPSDL